MRCMRPTRTRSRPSRKPAPPQSLDGVQPPHAHDQTLAGPRVIDSAARPPAPPAAPPAAVSMREIFWYFLRLGWLAFGGPVGQIGLMHLDVVERRRWLSEEDFVRALNFCHVLPGPEALQLAIYLGYKRRGYLAGTLAGILFILPGYITLTALAWIYVHYGKTPEVLGVLWGFRPVGLALLLAA